MPVQSVIDVVANTTAKNNLNKPLVEWRNILSQECQVYVFDENYLAKRFDQINYKFCGVKEAEEILKDNLFALLRYKYFPKLTDEIDKRIQEIVKSFTVNIKTSLMKISFDENTDAIKVYELTDSQVAFRNGVFDFRTNDWLFKYQIISLPEISSKIYMYDEVDKKYIIHWYFNFDFDPLPININEINLIEFINIMKELNKSEENYCFELLWNMAHDENHQFSFNKFNHICEILGYTVLQSFSQYFVLLIGTGQNGKNSLFDGCFINRVVPRAAANSLDDIETDRFIVGSLENKAHNIFLETSPKTYTESKMIKALTGSMYQFAEHKGLDKYSTVVNCKYIFSGNDQEKIKFSDTTRGFRRRINILEIFYEWDADGRFLKKNKDYYNTTFSDSLKELKDDISNTIAYIYFAMYGILSGTNNFTTNFKFNENDWKLSYSDIDFDLKYSMESLLFDDIVKFIKRNNVTFELCKNLFYDFKEKLLFNSDTMKQLNCFNYSDMVEKIFTNDELYISYFAEYDVYMNVSILRQILNYTGTAISFTSALKKIYNITDFKRLFNNQAYIKVRFTNGKMRIIV